MQEVLGGTRSWGYNPDAMRLRSAQLGILAVSLAAMTAPGCGKRLRGLETADQTLLHGRRTVLQQAGGVEAAVTAVRVPWGSRAEPVGFLVDLTNLHESPLSITVDQIELIDPFDRRTKPIPPERLLRSFGRAPRESASVRTASYRPYCYRRSGHAYRRYRVYHRHYPAYVTSYAGGPNFWWGGSAYYGPPYDPYAEYQRTARFLSELLIDQTVEPRQTIRGYLVFPYRLGSDDQLTLQLRTVRSASPATAQPAGAAGAEQIVLTFVFEVD